jgi:glutamate 5-kinase
LWVRSAFERAHEHRPATRSRFRATAQMSGSISIDGGATVALSGNLLVVIDLVEGTFAYDGQVFMAIDPGDRVLVQDTGRFLVDFDDNLLLEAGPHDAIDQGAKAFCGALA